ncbi:hypothetical protein B0H14DRAFT_2338137, partial [Mycena olivaceomarginata]
WCGLNLVTPIMHPVPVAAVVPKFYGYYVPVKEDSSLSYRAWHSMSPILLLEECGKPILADKFTPDERSECYSLALRLHYAEFTQNSFYVRNILRQPGPLTVAPSERSDKTPSFRIIDFGRGEHWPLKLEAANEKNESRRRSNKILDTAFRLRMNVPTEDEMKKMAVAEEEEAWADEECLKQARKKWWETRDCEVRKAHSELQIVIIDLLMGAS